jgi:hypothetical protein
MKVIAKESADASSLKANLCEFSDRRVIEKRNPYNNISRKE